MFAKSFRTQLQAEFRGYSLADLKSDVLAGFTVGAVALPLALAFGVASGATASAGLVTAILAGLIIGFLSGAPFQISGPTGAMSAILIVLSQKYGLQGVWIGGFFSGFFLLALGVFKLGRFISFIPVPVIVGFTSGIAIIIAVGQLDSLLGVETTHAESALGTLLNFLVARPAIRLPETILGLVVVAGMFAWPKSWQKIVPSSLALLIVLTAFSYLAGLQVATIGVLPATLLPTERLKFSDIPWLELGSYIVPVMAITALGAIESLLCGSVGSSLTNKRLHANQELIAQGVGNMLIPLFGGVPATAAIARTAVGIRAGGKTRMVSIAHAVLLLLSLFLLAPSLSKVPLAVLAGILIFTALHMNDWEAISFYFKKRLWSAIIPFVATLIATVSLDLTQSILIGTCISALIFLGQTTRIQLQISPVAGALLERSKIPYLPIFESTRVVYLSGVLTFASVSEMYEHIAVLKNFKVVILSMRGVPFIDPSGHIALEKLFQELQASNGKLIFAAVNPGPQDFLHRVGFTTLIGEQNFFWSTDQALRSLALET